MSRFNVLILDYIFWIQFLCRYFAVKDKHVPFYAIKAYRERRGLGSLILNLGIRWKQVANFAPLPPTDSNGWDLLSKKKNWTPLI
jgi:hypothetical protein